MQNQNFTNSFKSTTSIADNQFIISREPRSNSTSQRAYFNTKFFQSSKYGVIREALGTLEVFLEIVILKTCKT